MSLRNFLFRLLVAVFCSAAVSGASAQGGAGPRIYQVGEIAFSRYAVLERIWVGSWHSAFFLPTRADREGAIAALQEEAARLGADGIVNLHCLDDSGGLFGEGGHFCYANAIKLK